MSLSTLSLYQMVMETDNDFFSLLGTPSLARTSTQRNRVSCLALQLENEAGKKNETPLKSIRTCQQLKSRTLSQGNNSLELGSL
jgi:hypothetical protein